MYKNPNCSQNFVYTCILQVVFVGMGTMSPFWGMIADKYGRRNVKYNYFVFPNIILYLSNEMLLLVLFKSFYFTSIREKALETFFKKIISVTTSVLAPTHDCEDLSHIPRTGFKPGTSRYTPATRRLHQC